MNIVVCVKQVVDTEAVIALDGAGEVELTGQTMVIDPYSEFAVERAVQLKEELGGTVTLLTLGSQDCLAAVRHGLAMGADAAVLIEDDQWTARDAAQAAALLAEAASTMGADLVMGGWKSGDTAAAQVMGRMAAIMGLPLAKATPSSRNARWTTAWRPRAFLCPLPWPPSRGWPSRATPRCATSCRRGDVAPRCVLWPTLPRRPSRQR